MCPGEHWSCDDARSHPFSSHCASARSTTLLVSETFATCMEVALQGTGFWGLELLFWVSGFGVWGRELRVYGLLVRVSSSRRQTGETHRTTYPSRVM